MNPLYFYYKTDETKKKKIVKLLTQNNYAWKSWRLTLTTFGLALEWLPFLFGQNYFVFSVSSPDSSKANLVHAKYISTTHTLYLTCWGGTVTPPCQLLVVAERFDPNFVEPADITRLKVEMLKIKRLQTAYFIITEGERLRNINYFVLFINYISFKSIGSLDICTCR